MTNKLVIEIEITGDSEYIVNAEILKHLDELTVCIKNGADWGAIRSITEVNGVSGLGSFAITKPIKK